LQIGSTPFTHRKLGVGASLHTDQKLEALGPALLGLEGGGTLRIARGTVIRATNAHTIDLHDGEVYLDFPPDQHHSGPFVVRTTLGSIEHVGTQFEVTRGANEIRVRVREGLVRLRRASGIETASAGTELIVPENGPVVRQPVTTHGRQWSWVEALAPEFEIEDCPLRDFLQWTARETGRQLDITDERALRVVERTRLHGSVRGLTPLEALGRVLSATSLRFDLHDDAIRVSSGG
jgi:ferric-dicitrate binding protein FerR (iron transport regulator)